MERTRWETARIAVFPYGKSGLLGASILGFGRAVGETMLVTLIIGNAIGPAAIPTTLFSQSQTLSSLIANEFNEASSDLQLICFNWSWRSLAHANYDY